MQKHRPFVPTIHETQAIAKGGLAALYRQVKPAPPDLVAGGDLRDLMVYEGGEETWMEGAGLAKGLACPFGKTGDLLWLKETYAFEGRSAQSSVTHSQRAVVRYRADDPAARHGWRTPSSMPKWAARHFMLVDRVSVVWLSAVPENDAMALGLSREEFIRLWGGGLPADAGAGADPLLWRAGVRLVDSEAFAQPRAA